MGQGQMESADILAYLLGGPLTFGGLGWFLDARLGTGVFLPIGIIGGLALAVYVVWVRYGRG